MQDRIQPREGSRVAEHDPAERAPVDRSVGRDDARPERLGDLPEALGAGPVDVVPHPVGIDDVCAPLGQHHRDRTLARADPAGEADHRSPHRGRR